ncbi:MAG: WD40/YVTN/BNR-like repeat-containing protein [Caldimonas sp.]
MKTPDTATRTKVVKDRAAGTASIAPWGAASARVVVERPAKAGARTARSLLKEQVEVDHPEGKATARRRFFGLQRGLPGEEHVGEAAAAAEVAPKVRRARAQVAQATAGQTPAASFSAVAKAALPAWRDLGPTLIPHGQTYGSGAGSTPSVSGRCSGLMIDRANPRHLIVCSAGGGLWGSLDQGATWAPLTDQQPTLVMGAIAQSASSPAIVYAATGDGDGQIPYGMGLLRSSDGGATWTSMPLAALAGTGAYDLAVDPVDPLRVWIATDKGLFVSRNGGQTVQAAINGSCWSVSINAATPGEIMAAFSGGLMRSGDGGGTWAAVALPGTQANTRFKRLEVCHAPSNGAVVFVAGCVGAAPMLWRRAAAGAAFQTQNVPAGMKTSQAWYDWCLGVAPDDADFVLWGAIDLYRGHRTAAGITWTNVSSRSNGDSVHPDQHFVALDPASPGVVYSCNDGGLFRSADHCDHWVSLNPGLGVTEFEYLSQLDGNADWLFGGTQDNGSLSLAGPRHWDQVALGDGGDCAALDRGAASLVYHSYYDMPVERASALGASAFEWTDISPPVPDGYSCLFYPPLEARGQVLVKAGSSLWVSTDDGAHWQEVLLPTSGDADPDLATALAIFDDKRILAGMLSGQLWSVARGAGGWAAAKATKLGALPGYVSDIAVVGAAAKTLWATCSQIGVGHVFRSLNGGKTFSDRTGNLPDMAVNALVVDPKKTSHLFIATDRGVWRSTNSGVAWSAFNNGLPNVIVGDLVLHAATRRLRAGTRARGAWEVVV